MIRCHLLEQSMALTLVPCQCRLCPAAKSVPLGTGEDFECHTTPDWFLAVQILLHEVEAPLDAWTQGSRPASERLGVWRLARKDARELPI